MKIGTKRAINTRLAAIAMELEQRIQHWAAYAQAGGKPCAQQRMEEAVHCKQLVESRIVPLKDEPDE